MEILRIKEAVGDLMFHRSVLLQHMRKSDPAHMVENEG
jgi:hypothetical protein